MSSIYPKKFLVLVCFTSSFYIVTGIESLADTKETVDQDMEKSSSANSQEELETGHCNCVETPDGSINCGISYPPPLDPKTGKPRTFVLTDGRWQVVETDSAKKSSPR